MFLENQTKDAHIVLIGTGIMSATLAVLLKELAPQVRVTMIERLDRIASESSDAWNNAGTGHAAYCELNYTPIKENGRVDVSKAVNISDSFEKSKQFWAYLLRKNYIKSGHSFATFIPHCSFVFNDKDREFLKNRFDALKEYSFFENMDYTEDPAKAAMWFPLIMQGRNTDQNIASTRVDQGLDINFGALTRGMINHLDNDEANVDVYLGTEVRDITRQTDGRWQIQCKNLHTKKKLVRV